ncbi:hypothetical protein [Streptomyces sp. NPDC057939]|uniref:hypothetical protein n=1 Tax=Streptomyces sp. NPDC057939 TaxID=3346284 RepID=UPI0036E4A32F
MSDTSTRRSSTEVHAVDIGLMPMVLPVLPVDQRGCSCNYCVVAKETFIAPPSPPFDAI